MNWQSKTIQRPKRLTSNHTCYWAREKDMENRIIRKRAKRTRGIRVRRMDRLGNKEFCRNNIPNHFP
jgi:hypothetical protein